MVEAKLDLPREELPLRVHFTIGSGKDLDGTQKNKRLVIDTTDLIDRTFSATSPSISEGALSCKTISGRFRPESVPLRRRFGLMHPEIEQERIAIIALQEEKAALRNQEAEKIIMQNDVSSLLEEMQEQKKNLQDARRFCQTHGFAGINEPRKRFNGRKYALHSAVKKNDARMVGILLRVGANPNAIDSRKQTPLQLAETLQRLGKFDMTAVIEQFLQADSLDWDCFT